MVGEANRISDIKDESEDFYSNDDLFHINSWGADLSFRELVDRYKENEIIKPELQRHYVWDRAEASRFIDSILLGLPLPSIFLAQVDEEKMLIIDGYQRIMTVHDFITGRFSTDQKVFKLSRSKRINSRWAGKAFVELSDTERRRIRNTTIHTIIFTQVEPKSGNSSLYQIFERINTSGRTLLPQEIRNCIYQGSFNKLLMELNELPEWRALFGREAIDPRMRDIELILRFFALGSQKYLEGDVERLSLKLFLNEYMQENSDIDEATSESMKNRFTDAIRYLYAHFGEVAFKNISPKSRDGYNNKISPTLFDSMMVATDRLLNSGETVQDLQNIENRRIELLATDDEFDFAISQETMSRSSIDTRIRKIQDVVYAA